MKEYPLTDFDKRILSDEIGASKLAILFTNVIGLVLGLIFGLVGFFGVKGFLLPFLSFYLLIGVIGTISFLWTIAKLKKDLNANSKRQFIADNYEVINKKDKQLLKVSSPFKLKFKFTTDDLLKIIPVDKKLKIEYTPTSKTIVFISGDGENLIRPMDT
jgi:hypothetical protein